MVMKSGERWHCTNPACSCTILVEINAQADGANPRCSCGGLMKQNYSPPVFRYLEFLYLNKPAFAPRTSGKD